MQIDVQYEQTGTTATASIERTLLVTSCWIHGQHQLTCAVVYTCQLQCINIHINAGHVISMYSEITNQAGQQV